jgi:Raf kinase inhibitor-like YbhB/YbcL family protein
VPKEPPHGKCSECVGQMALHLTLVALATTFGALLSTAVLAQTPPATNPPMVLTSSSFPDGGVIPDKYTVNGAHPGSFALSWENAPPGTVSFTLIMHDLDTLPRKTGPDNLHWMLINIPASVHALPEGMPAEATLPDGTIQPMTQAGRAIGFLPPGAPPGPYHHYLIELYALDTKLKADPGAVPVRSDILGQMEGHVIGKAFYVGRFHK